MNKVYDDLIIINLYCIEDEEVCVDRGGGHACTMPATARAPIRPGLPPCRRPIALIKWPLRAIKAHLGFFQIIDVTGVRFYMYSGTISALELVPKS